MLFPIPVGRFPPESGGSILIHSRIAEGASRALWRDPGKNAWGFGGLVASASDVDGIVSQWRAQIVSTGCILGLTSWLIFVRISGRRRDRKGKKNP